jgi:hypothetical protein
MNQELIEGVQASHNRHELYLHRGKARPWKNQQAASKGLNKRTWGETPKKGIFFGHNILYSLHRINSWEKVILWQRNY